MRPYYQNRNYEEHFPVYSTIHSDFTYAAHWHPEVEIAYVLEGNLSMGINEQLKLLGPGDMAICSSKDIHYYEASDSQVKWILLLFRPSIIGVSERWSGASNHVASFIIKEMQNQTCRQVLMNIEQRLLNICSEMQQKPDFFQQMVIGELHAISSLLFRYFAKKDTSTQVSLAGEGQGHLELIRDVLDFIDSHFTERLELSRVASEFHLAPSHLSSLFTRMTGMNFVSYIHNKKVEKAKYMLRHESVPIIVVAQECGFNHLRTFNRVFLNQTGTTPSAYRNSGKSG